MSIPVFLEAIARHWWVMALRGAIAVLFGIMAFVWPGMTLAVLVLLYGAYVLLDGIFAVVAGGQTRTWSLLVVGLIGVAAGIITFLWPGITALALLYIIAFASIFRGAFEIAAAIQWRKVLENEWVLFLGGLASVTFGLLVLAFPGAGALSIIWLIGVYAIVYGVLLFIHAFRLRSMPARLGARL